jgi:hypothetical protein
MEIDFPKVVLLVLAVLPGYFALRARKSIAPRSLHKKGATEELAEFLVYSALAHIILSVVLIVTVGFVGLIAKGHPLYFIHGRLALPLPELGQRILKLPASLLLIYLPLSFACGWFVGFARGLITVWRPFSRLATKFGVDEDSKAGKLWLRWIGRFLLTGRPIIYDVLFPDADENGTSNLVFVEVTLKDNAGMFIGQVKAFSVLSDEEEHKLLYLIDVYRRNSDDAEYQPLEVDGVLIDLSEALTISVRQASD